MIDSRRYSDETGLFLKYIY